VRLHSADSFVLGTYALRETDRIVSFLTRDSGKKRGVARGARRAKSAFAGTLEPMTEARVVYYEKEGKELVSINSADPIRPSFSLSKDLDRALLLSALAESLETFVSESEPAEPFYRLARHVMDGLFGGSPASLAGAYFDVWILKLSGLLASPRECAGCGRPIEADEPLLFEEARPGFVGPECRRTEALLRSLGRRVPSRPSGRGAGGLTRRELEVLALLADGLSNAEIAGALFVALGTVKTHVHNLCAKLSAPSRGRAVARARELGLLPAAGG